ncbi:MAG: DUF3108 domain-containing protein [Saprospiraceae bacterium]|nr:DUF3108 domain-containing protein [Saprospiraceae bacterium]
MVKKLVVLILCFLTASGFLTKDGYQPPDDLCVIENTSFASGEKLVYKAYYNWKFIWIPAGEAEFYIKENRFDYEIRVLGKTYESYDNFFRVRDYFYSKIEKKTLYPKSFVRHIEEGDYRKFDSISFDQVNRTAVSFNGKTRASATPKKVNFDECMHDLLSVLYFMRNINVDSYKKGEYIPTKVFFDNETFPIKVKYDGKDAKKSIKELGTFKTIRVIPDLVVGNVFKDGDKMKVWVSDDANKLPLLIESPLKIGSAKAILKSHSGLRHPLIAKIK